MLNALQPLSDLLFGGMYPSLRQQTAQAHILHFKTEDVARTRPADPGSRSDVPETV